MPSTSCTLDPMKQQPKPWAAENNMMHFNRINSQLSGSQGAVLENNSAIEYLILSFN
jgi:hypothetical protein